jgi:NAD(P)-dependent dehydrogenase (short-subunit alcohol dehydrogenase family)
VTGATSGLGRHVVRELAGAGATVLVHGRDPARTERLAQVLGGRAYVADVASLAEVRRLATEVREREPRLDVLVNNAGVGPGSDRRRRMESADGLELLFAVNHLAHFVLTLELLPLLEASAPARIVNVSSAAQAPIDFGDPLLERSYEGFRAYAQSKLAQVAFTYELAERLSVRGADVSVTALHPASLMDTRMVREGWGEAWTSVEEGARPTLRLIADPARAGVSGRYFDGEREARPHAQARDPDARRRIWELSERLAGRA